MSFSVAWDETSPAGTQDISLGDDRIREFKTQFRERFAVDHHASAADDGNTGYHEKTTLINQASDPAQVASALILYSKTAAGVRELFSRHETAALQQLTLNGKLWLSALSIAGISTGDIFYYNGSIVTRLGIGSALQLLRVNAGATAPEYYTPTPIFSISYTSPAQTITVAGSLTLAHSLGATPVLLSARLICTSAELGYSINDELFINPSINGAFSGNTGISIVPDATNLNIRFGSSSNVFEIVRKDTGAISGLTPAKWNIIFRAWA